MKLLKKLKQMKSKEFFKLVFNPFSRIAGLEAFGLGLFFVVLMGIIGTFSHTIFDGVLDIHIVRDSTLANSFIMLGVDILALTLIMWIAGLIISRNIRFIDILGTMTLSKAPLLLASIAAFFTKVPDTNTIMHNPMVLLSSVSFIVVMILIIPITIWSIALMYNALKVSCGVKGGKLTAAFIIGLFVAEIVSKVAIYFFVK